MSTQASSQVFLVGAERSGTTLLRLMLDHHPDLSFYFEFDFAVERVPDDGWPPLDEYYEFLRTRRFAHRRPTIDATLSYPELMRSFLEEKRLADGKSRSGAPVHRHFDRLLRIWPDATFIHLVRDARDVAQSCVGMNWAGTAYIGVERWMEVERLWQNVAETVGPERFLDVRYENLVSEPRSELERICAFMGLRFSEAMFDYTRSSRYGFPDKSLAYQWRRSMSRREIELVEARAADMLVERGYPLSGFRRLEVGPLENALLALQNRAAVASGHVKRYGPLLWAENAIARRLHIDPWAARVQARLHQITNESLK